MTEPGRFPALTTDELQHRLAAATDPHEIGRLERELDRRVTAELLGEPLGAIPPLTPSSQPAPPTPPPPGVPPPRDKSAPTATPAPPPGRAGPPAWPPHGALPPADVPLEERQEQRRRGRVGRLFAVLVAAAVVVGGASLVLQALGQSSSNPSDSTTRPASSGGSSDSGLTGSALVAWSIGVERYTATISVDPTSGVADVMVENSPIGTYQIRQDLSYDATTGRYVGSDVRDPDTGRAVSPSVYEPDIFVLGPGTGGRRTVVQVCGSTTCYPATTTPL